MTIVWKLIDVNQGLGTSTYMMHFGQIVLIKREQQDYRPLRSCMELSFLFLFLWNYPPWSSRMLSSVMNLKMLLTNECCIWPSWKKRGMLLWIEFRNINPMLRIYLIKRLSRGCSKKVILSCFGINTENQRAYMENLTLYGDALSKLKKYVERTPLFCHT